MSRNTRRFLIEYGIPVLIGLGTVALVCILRWLGAFQTLELHTLDGMLQIRPIEPRDERIVIVGITEEDLQQLGVATISDQVMADLIRRIQAQQPRVIGLDFYRNLPVEPGRKALLDTLEESANLVGIEKVIADRNLSAVRGNPVLARKNQVAASDVLVDPDGRVRRGLLFPATQGPRILEGFALRVALDYLTVEGIVPDAKSTTLKLGNVNLPPFKQDDGGYVRADAGGYQILLNMRHPVNAFRKVSLMEMLEGKIPPNLMSDRIVMIGSMAVGDSDVFFSAYSSAFGPNAKVLYGVELHANLASQIISAVMDGRPATIRTLSEKSEILFLLLCAGISVSLYRLNIADWQRVAWNLGGMGCVAGVSFLALWLVGWWLPIIPALATTLGTALSLDFYKTRQFKWLSAKDELTRLANRRTFNEALQREWQQGVRSRHPVSLIICDVDYFKIYNDTYGHVQGDECLRAIARAIKTVIKRPTDLAARYGGEEFVVLLPNTDTTVALAIADEIRQHVKALKLEHKGSQISSFVSLSLGVTAMLPSADQLPNTLIEIADLGLYEAKQAGRDQAVFKFPPKKNL